MSNTAHTHQYEQTSRHSATPRGQRVWITLSQGRQV